MILGIEKIEREREREREKSRESKRQIEMKEGRTKKIMEVRKMEGEDEY